MPTVGPWPNLVVAALLALFVPLGGWFIVQARAQISEAEHSPEAAESAEDQRDSDPTEREDPSVKEPELLYLTWQANEWKPDGQPIDLTFWRPDGTLVSEELVKVHKAFPADPADRRFKVHYRREQDAELELHPLVMVFRIDDRLRNATVQATVTTDDGRRSRIGTAVISKERRVVGLVRSGSSQARDRSLAGEHLA